MKIKFKHQSFQREAAEAVCDVFAGQPLKELSYMIDPGIQNADELKYKDIYMGFKNNPITRSISEDQILENMHKLARLDNLSFF